MRYSRDPKTKPRVPVSPRQSNAQFLDRIWESGALEGVDVALLLVGGCDCRALAIRRAQAVLRFDRRPSLWSHAAILFALDAKTPGRSRGVEVSLDPVDAKLQVPERNGVTEFKLSRYLDTQRYPNLAFVTATFLANGKPAPDSRAKLIERLSEPSSDPQRYMFWNALAEWARYTYIPDLTRNPLLDGISTPDAALCEFAFEGVQVDLTPGASANNTCPELIWSTITHWQSSLEKQVDFRAYVVLRNEDCTPPSVLSLKLDLMGRAGARRSRARR